jgi:hypothetical protein
MLKHRLSSKLHCSADTVLSFGNVASRLPISTHSFERQLTKDTLATIEEMLVKSERATVRSLKSMIGDGVLTASADGFVYTVG